jgi:CubicO group peptidase (beta-lactamase class C family)
VRQPDGSLKPVAPKSRGGAWPSGGGGLYSTPADYVRFAQMLLNRGELGGVRLLSPKMVELMTQDHLHGIPKPTKIYPVSDGFGYGVEIRTDVARSQWLGSVGTFGWNGASTAYCSMDPKEGLISMVWSQHTPNSEFELFERFNNLVYQALDE